MCVFTMASAQGGSLLALKDKGVVVRSYTAGNYIQIQLDNQQWITGYIDWIRNDSVQIKQFALQSGLTYLGTIGQDTLRLGKIALHKSEITAFPKPRGHYNSVFTNGTFLKAAGIGYVGLNVMNSLLKKDPVFESKNVPKLVGGAAAWIIGKFIQKSNPNYCPIGKRFSVEIL